MEKSKFISPVLAFIGAGGLFLAVGVAPAMAAAITVSSNSDWSALSPQPTAADAVMVTNNAILRVNQADAVAQTIDLGGGGGSGTLSFAAGGSVSIEDLIIGHSTSETGNLDMTNKGTLNISGAVTVNNLGTWTPDTGTVNFNGSGGQTIPALPSLVNSYLYPAYFYNLVLSGDSTKILPANLTVNGNFTTSGTCSVTTSGHMDFNKNFTVGAGTTFNEKNNMVSVGGDILVEGTFIPGTGQVNLGLSASQNVTLAAFHDFTLSGGGTKTINLLPTITGRLLPGAGMVANLNYPGTGTANYMVFMVGPYPTTAVTQAAGIWGPIGSGAEYTDARFKGTGFIKVLFGPVTVTSSKNPSHVGEAVTFTAAVDHDDVMPAGTVSFVIDGHGVGGSIPLVDGAAAITVSNLAAGNHNVTATYYDNGTVGTLAGGQTVTVGDPTLSITNSPVVYSGNGQAAAIIGSVPGTVSNIRYNGVLSNPVDAGSYAVTANFVPDDTAHNNSLTDAPAGNFVIVKANPTVKVTPYTVTYDRGTKSCIGTVTGVKNEDLGVPDLSATFHADANVYDDPWTWSDTTGNYNDANGTVHNVINKADPVCVINGVTRNYDGNPHGAWGSCTMRGNDFHLDGLDLGAKFTNVPGGTANWTFADPNGNFNGDSGNVQIVIKKVDPVITVTPYVVNFDGAAHTATGTATGVNGESLTGLSLSGTTHTLAGVYADIWTFTDSTGNYSNASGTVTDTIAALTLKGFYQPVDMSTPSGLIYNTVKNGSTVPLKFEIFSGMTELTDTNSVLSLKYSQTTCDANAITDEIETLATGGTVLRYDGGQFIYNWKTPATAGKCYRVTMTALDGSTLQAYFKLK